MTILFANNATVKISRKLIRIVLVVEDIAVIYSLLLSI